MPDLLLAVDPSIRASGWALWEMGGKCLRAGVVTATAPGRMSWEVWAWFCRALPSRPDRLRLALEEAPVTTRRGNPANLFKPGMAAGLWLAEWRRYCDHIRARKMEYDLDLVTVADWRLATLGPRKTWVYPDPKKMAELVALQVWHDHGVTYEGPPSLRHNAVEATLIGEYVAKGLGVIGETKDGRV